MSTKLRHNCPQSSQSVLRIVSALGSEDTGSCLTIAAAGLPTQGLNSSHVPVGPLHWRSAKLREKENALSATRPCPWKPTWLRAWADLTNQRWSW